MPFGSGDHNLREFAHLLIFSSVGAAITVAARIGLKAFRTTEEPPADPIAFDHWKQRQLWMVYAELSAFPTFGVIAAIATMILGKDWLVGLASGMLAGALGFPFLLHAAQTIVRLRLGLKPEGGAE